MQRLIRISLLVLFLVGQIVIPVRAYAFFPAIAGLIQLGGMAMEGITVGQVITGAAITIGASAAATCTTCTNKGPVSVGMSPAGMALPSGWSRNAGTGAPTPPATTPPSGGGDPSAPGPGSAPMDVANWYALHHPDMMCGPNSSAVAISPTLFRCWASNSTWTNEWTPPAAPTCPAGYVMNGGSCAVGSDGPDAVQKPTGMDCEAYFKAGKFSFDNLNPTCLAAAKDGFATAGDGTKVMMSGGGMTVIPAGKTDPTAVIEPTATGARVMVLGNSSDGKVQTSSTELEYITGASGGMTVTGQSVTAGNHLGGSSTPGTGTGTGTGTVPQKITCQDVNTCGVAQDSTLSNIAANLKDFFANFTTVVQVPQIYTPNRDTFKSKFQAFQQAVSSTPFVNSTAGFFKISIGAGTCPIYTIPSIQIDGAGSLPAVTIDQFCSTPAQMMFHIIYGVFCVTCAFFAFRRAIE